MELLRSWGLEDAVRKGAADLEPRGWVTHTLVSGTGSELPLGYPTVTEAAQVSPSGPAWVPQDHLEPQLLACLRAKAPVARIAFHTELIALRQDANGVRAVLRDRESGRTRTIATPFLVAADGAHSTVRTELGIPMEGPGAQGEYETVEFEAPLTRIMGERRYGLNVIRHPDVGGVVVGNGPGDRWHLGRARTPGEPAFEDWTRERLAKVIATAAGVPDLRSRIGRVSAYSFAALIAKRYRDRRVFLVGDAAHRMTPRGGTGMNTAIQDAYDLAWKLAWVLRSWAGPALLDTYETERRPVGLHNVMRSSDPDGARRPTQDALAWDLNGRIPHRWLRRGVSTLDLLGDGLTLLTARRRRDGANDLAGERDGPGSRSRERDGAGGRAGSGGREGYGGNGGPGAREGSSWGGPADAWQVRAPVTTHVLSAATARALGIPPGGSLLLRPDGREALSSGLPGGWRCGAIASG